MKKINPTVEKLVKKLVDAVSGTIDSDDYRTLSEPVFKAVVLSLCDYIELDIVEAQAKYYKSNDVHNKKEAKANLLIIKKAMQKKIDLIDKIISN